MRGIGLGCTILGLVVRKSGASSFEPLYSADPDTETPDVGYNLSVKIPDFALSRLEIQERWVQNSCHQQA